MTPEILPLRSSTSVRTFTNAAEAARWYIEQGFSVVPVPYQEKEPNRKGWQKLRIAAARPVWDWGERGLQMDGFIVVGPWGIVLAQLYSGI